MLVQGTGAAVTAVRVQMDQNKHPLLLQNKQLLLCITAEAHPATQKKSPKN